MPTPLKSTPFEPAPLNPALVNALAPPIMAAAEWVAGRTFPADRPLINVAQAVPADPPPLMLRNAMADAVLNDPSVHLYGPVLGDEELRDEISQRWSHAYGGDIARSNVAVTAGCNQAFCAAIASVGGAGDEVILPTPWYFNHKMWLDMAEMTTVPLPCGDDCLPNPEQATALITQRTKAIVLVTPNNPTGAIYSPALVAEFANLAKEHGLALIIDETYRDYISDEKPPHDQFQDPDWGDYLIHLYSFSKLFRLTGHRTGALIAGAARVEQIEKFLDTTTICPPRLGQVAALTGLRAAAQLAPAERKEFNARKSVLVEEFNAGVGDWSLLSAGAFFAYVRHPFEADSETVAKALVEKASLLCLPGTMFAPRIAEGGDGMAEQTCRIAFANVDAAKLREVAARLRSFEL
jgi:aspartate/methionine/tyrosine aminotransferase